MRLHLLSLLPVVGEEHRVKLLKCVEEFPMSVSIDTDTTAWNVV
jgi:hypothetical protein